MSGTPVGGKSRTVFVGNISYDTSEDELRNIFCRVGSVDSFRLVFDRDTKQPKGYGFCDYADPDMAAAAVKSLKEVEVNGRRLRVDLTELGKGGGKGDFGPPGGRLALPAPSGPPPPMALGPPSGSIKSSSSGSQLPLPSNILPLRDPRGPPPVDPAVVARQIAEAQATPAHTEIAQKVAAMPKAQMQLCLGSMQRLAKEAPESARTMLLQKPELCYALLQAQLLLGLSNHPSVPPGEEEMQQLRMQAQAQRTGVMHDFASSGPMLGGIPGISPGVHPIRTGTRIVASIVPPLGQPSPPERIATAGASVGLAPKASPLRPGPY